MPACNPRATTLHVKNAVGSGSWPEAAGSRAGILCCGRQNFPPAETCAIFTAGRAANMAEATADAYSIAAGAANVAVKCRWRSKPRCHAEQSRYRGHGRPTRASSSPCRAASIRSVTAALLADAGYDVVGITLQLYDHGAATHRKGACCAGRDIHDARAVAERIGIPHYVLDYESRFKEAVIDRFADSYVARRDAGAVRRMQSVDQVPRSAGDRARARRRACWRPAITSPRARCRAAAARSTARREAERDQSYFLFATTRAQLDLLRFPLGERTKAETRELARRFGLPVADKQDSQDICFVPTGHYAEVIERLRPGAAGAGRDRRSRRPRARPP